MAPTPLVCLKHNYNQHRKGLRCINEKTMVTKFKSVLFLTVALFLASCGGNKSNENNVTDNQDSVSSEQTSDDQSQYVQLMEKQAQTEGEGCPYKM